MASVSMAAPQFRVNRLADALAFYTGRLGFHCGFIDGDGYAIVARDGATIHLKCVPKLDEERAHRTSDEHADVNLSVLGIRELHDEFLRRGAPITRALAKRRLGTQDFYVEDPDGYILCFAEGLPKAPT